MKNLSLLFLIIITPTLFIPSSLAQEKSLVPLPSLDDFTKGEDGWALGLGLSVEYETAYEGSDEYQFEVDPAGALQWRSGDHIFYLAGEALGWRGLVSKAWLVEALVGMEERREESDSDDTRLKGLGNGEEGVELVLQARRDVGSDWRYWLDGRLVAGENGSQALLAAGRRFGDKSDGTGHEVGLALVFHDSDYANKDFGITAQQSAASGLRATNLGGGFRSVGFNYNYREYISTNWQVIAEAVYEHYSNDIQDSPIARHDFESEIGFGLIYVF